MAAAAPRAGWGQVRTGAACWLRSYPTMVGWELVSLRVWLPSVMLIQALGGAGFVLGIALFFDHIPQAARFVSSGVPVILMLMLGLMLGPRLLADQR